jgi:hypothetical protein
VNNLQQLKDRVVDGYLSYKLNAAQVTKLSQELDQGDTLAHDLDAFEQGQGSDDHSKDGLPGALDKLGVTEMVDSLGQDKPWTAREKAAYRRLRTPDELVNLSAPVKSESAQPFLAAAEKLLPSIDTDHDGHLTLAEIDHGMADPALHGEASGVLGAERHDFKKMTQDNAGLSAADLENFVAHGSSSETSQVAVEFHNFTLRSDQFAAQPSVPIEQEHIGHFDFQQGSAGSCVEMSTIATLTDSKLQSMFHTNDDGTITVHFADGKNETVAEPTPTERAYQARGISGERWPAVLEMAMGQRIAETGPDKLPRTAMNGQNIAGTLKAFTGEEASVNHLDQMSLNQTREALEKAVSTGESIVVGSLNARSDDKDLNALNTLHNGIHNNHAYAVLGYDAKQDLVTLRNPWHKKEWVVNPDGVDDGIFKMPLADMNSSYNLFVYTTPGK